MFFSSQITNVPTLSALLTAPSIIFGRLHCVEKLSSALVALFCASPRISLYRAGYYHGHLCIVPLVLALSAQVH